MSTNFSQPTTLSSLLGQNNQLLSVPPYQRPYSWGKDQIEELFRSLINFKENKNQFHQKDLFLGTILIHDKGGEDDTISNYDIIDGQQRITSLTLFIALLYNLFTKEYEFLNESEKEKIEEIPDSLKMMIYHNSKYRKYRLEPLPEDKLFFEETLDSLVKNEDFNFKAKKIDKEKNRFKRNCLYFYELLEDEFNKLKLEIEIDKVDYYREFYTIFNKYITCLVLKVNKEDDPLLYFESLNSTGLPLTFMDLLKNYIFIEQDEEAKEKIKREWDLTFTSKKKEALWNEDSPSNTSRKTITHLEFFFNEVYPKIIIPRSPQNISSRYKSYKNFIDEEAKKNDINIKKEKYNKLLEINKYADAYYDLFEEKEENEINKIFKPLCLFMKSFNLTQYYHIIILGIKEEKEKSSININKLKIFKELLFSYIYRRALLSLETTGINKFLQETLLEYKNKKKENYTDFISFLKNKFSNSCTDDIYKFVTSSSFPSNKYLKEKIYNINFKDSKKIKFLLIELERRLTEEERNLETFSIYENKKIEIEHILPQSKVSEFGENTVYQLGNLVILEKLKNIKLSDKTYQEKRKILKEQTIARFALINHLIDTYETFSIEEVTVRTDWLLSKIIKLFPEP